MKNFEQIVEKCVKGQFLTIVAETSISDMDGKQLKKSPYLGQLRKETTYTAVRFCDYENLASTKEKREQGIEAQKPTWWEWVKFPYIARHKTKGTLYVVVKPTTEYPSSKYFLNGVEVSSELVKPNLKKVSGESTVYMLKLESITYLQQGNILYKRG